MAHINNSELTNQMVESARIQLSNDKVPTELAEKVVPVMEVNPKLIRYANKVLYSAATSDGTLFTVPTNKDFIITAAWAEVPGAAGASNPYRTITCVIGGETVTILRVSRVIAATVTENATNALSLCPGIKVDSGSIIAFTASLAGEVGVIGCLIEKEK
jgi:hypothetical protein